MTVLAHYTTAALDALQERVAKVEAEKAQLAEAAITVLLHRVGDRPTLGYLRDSERSRDALAALAEGLDTVCDGRTPYGVKGIARTWNRDPRKSYAELWATINGAGSWDANPWVWVVEFRRIAA